MEEKVLVPYVDLERMAASIAKSALFGLQSPEQVLSLLLLAQSEGLHPMQALRRYDIVEGKPAMKAQAMVAAFQERGGILKWEETSAEIARASFQRGPTSLTVEIRMSDLRARGITQGKDGKTKRNYERHPSEMLRARCTSAGVRAVDPGATLGMHAPEEIEGEENLAVDGVPEFRVLSCSEARGSEAVTPPQEEPQTSAGLDAESEPSVVLKPGDEGYPKEPDNLETYKYLTGALDEISGPLKGPKQAFWVVTIQGSKMSVFDSKIAAYAASLGKNTICKVWYQVSGKYTNLIWIEAQF